MSERDTAQPFGGIIGTTVAESTPWWPEPGGASSRRRNVLIVLLDDVGFADFGCYGSTIETPTIDRLAAEGIRATGFHTTAMCSTTRASLLTGRNHHAVGMGCLANFDSGFPGYRGKIAADAPTIAEMLAPHGYRSYMIGKWHATRTTETGPTGPFDGWPLGRGFDRFYGFLDAETDQYSPELVRDNTHITAAGDHSTGYHLTVDLVDEAIRNLTDHHAATPDAPWYLQLSPGACHAPHQAPSELIDRYAAGVRPRVGRRARPPPRPPDRTRHRAHRHRAPAPQPRRASLGRALGRRAAAVQPARRAPTRRCSHHFDEHLGRVIATLEQTGQLDDTIVMVLSDNGASQEGGPLGFVNAMAPFNMVKESLDDKLARLDDIGGPDTHSNFPHGWAMAANTPLRMYKQNTHGGGIRDPLVVRTPDTAAMSAGELRHQFCHASDLAPTVLDLVGIEPPAEGTPMTGVSLARALRDADAATGKSVQYFEMFGHRGIWHEGWKAVAWHRPGSAFEEDRWELFDLTQDFNECHDLADAQPERLAALVELWWSEARANQVLPLDDRFGERFAENAERFHGERRRYVFTSGMGHLPSDVAPDLRSRSYTITAQVQPLADGTRGVLIAHGDATCGYSLFVRDGHLVHDLNIGGTHQVVSSEAPIPVGATDARFPDAPQRRTGPVPARHRHAARRRCRGRTDGDRPDLLVDDLVVRPRHRPRPWNDGCRLRRVRSASRPVRVHRLTDRRDGRTRRRPGDRPRRSRKHRARPGVAGAPPTRLHVSPAVVCGTAVT